MKLFLGMICLFIFACSPAEDKPLTKTVDLNASWQFRQQGQEAWQQASVPGSVQADLLALKQIPNPYFGLNEKSIQWIEKLNWEYQKVFNWEGAVDAFDFVRLQFEGLDSYADVYLNDHLILRADNMFRRWEINAKDFLKTGQNKLYILFRSPLKVHAHTADSLGYKLPADNDASKLKVSPFVRKAPYQFGWDWSPRIVTMGIWRGVKLIAENQVSVKDVYFEQTTISKEKAELCVHLKALTAVQKTVKLRVRQGTKVIASKTIELSNGLFQDTLQFQIDQPKLWWTNGLGDPYRYNWTFEIIDPNSVAVMYRNSYKIGLRKIELVREKDAIGTSYYFKLNGQPVFMKGANYIPQDNLLSRVAYHRYEKLIKDVVGANMNMLRVWGGGIYEEDTFYEMCDQQGILVWQDFMFACSMYPATKTFHDNVLKEVEDNVKRLRNYACIALWCGNNEIEVAWKNWGWPKAMAYNKALQQKLFMGYKMLFDSLIPQAIQQLHPQVAYVSTSPLSNWGKVQNFNHHSMHYWGVWHGKAPFEKYSTQVGRFMSEYGFQSFPSFETIRLFADSSQWALQSAVMQHHQKSYIGNELIKKHILKYYPAPRNFKDLVYLSQLSQAKGIAKAIRAHRSNAKCMGTLYWQLNDCWPGPSWSSIDYYGRWKALHYKVRDLYKDVVLVVDSASVNQIAIQVVSDRNIASSGKLLFELMTLDGVRLRYDSLDVQIKPLSSTASNYSFSTVLPLEEPLNNLFYRVVYQDEQGRYTCLHYFVPEKQLQLKQLNLIADFDQTTGGYALTISCPVLIKNVCLSSAKKIDFSENFFDLIPNETKRVFIKTNQKLNYRDIELRSLNELMYPIVER